MGTYLAEHSIDTMIVVTNTLLAHVTWRTLPDDHRHHVRQAVVKVRRVRVVSVIVRRRAR